MHLSLFPATLKGRLLLTYLVLILSSVGGLSVWAAGHFRDEVEERAEHELEIEAHLVASTLREPLEETREEEERQLNIQVFIQQYTIPNNPRITILDETLWVLASSDARFVDVQEENHVEFVAARNRIEQHDTRWDEIAREERLFVAAPILDEHGNLLGFTQLSVPTAPVSLKVRQSMLTVSGVVGTVLILTIMVSLVLARQISRPLEDLIYLSEDLARGELDRRISPAGPQEIRRLSLAFNRMAGQLRQMLDRQREFAGNAAHELRSPLTALRLRLELLQNEGASNPELTQHYITQMLSELDYLQRMVDQLLALSILEEGDQLPREPLDLAPLLYDLTDELNPLIQSAGQKWYVNVPAHLPLVLVNAEQTTIAIRNLLDNARKYNSPGGSVSLQTKIVDGYIEVHVSDTGPGIPDAELPRIFERFYRGSETRLRNQSGSGLGLALARVLVESNGGQIKVESQIGAGTTFTITLPIITRQDR